MPIALIAQAGSQPEIPAAFIAAVIAFVVGMIVIGLIIGAIVAYLIYKPYSKLPAEHHTIAPGLCFLLLVPFVNLVMPIILGTKLPEAFAGYFDATGQTAETGDAGKSLGMWWGISTLCCIVPVVNMIAGIAALVLIIMFIIKLWDMAKRIDGGGDGVATPGGPAF